MTPCDHPQRFTQTMKTNQDGSIYPPHDTLVTRVLCAVCREVLATTRTIR